ncbi:hypothetical protein [Terrisporobacter sp.]
MFNKNKCKNCFKFASKNNSLGYKGELYLSKYDCCRIDKIVKDNTYKKAFKMYAFDKDNNLINCYNSKDIIFINV